VLGDLSSQADSLAEGSVRDKEPTLLVKDQFCHSPFLNTDNLYELGQVI
jgi:hypothetical protein